MFIETSAKAGFNIKVRRVLTTPSDKDSLLRACAAGSVPEDSRRAARDGVLVGLKAGGAGRYQFGAVIWPR